MDDLDNMQKAMIVAENPLIKSQMQQVRDKYFVDHVYEPGIETYDNWAMYCALVSVERVFQDDNILEADADASMS